VVPLKLVHRKSRAALENDAATQTNLNRKKPMITNNDQGLNLGDCCFADSLF
jgi:hypothetical protein